MTVAAELWDYPHPHTFHTQVAEEDIDGLRHTNNAVYVKWCGQVAWSHSIALGLGLKAYQRLNRAMAITHSNYHYLRASQAGDEVVVGTWIVEWDRRLTMSRHFQVIRISDGETLLRGDMRFACIELDTGRPRRLPREFIEGYGAAVLNPDP